MYRIQWYDVMGNGKALKAGPPRGNFKTKEEAVRIAEMAIERHGAWEGVSYEVVKNG